MGEIELKSSTVERRVLSATAAALVVPLAFLSVPGAALGAENAEDAQGTGNIEQVGGEVSQNADGAQNENVENAGNVENDGATGDAADGTTDGDADPNADADADAEKNGGDASDLTGDLIDAAANGPKFVFDAGAGSGTIAVSASAADVDADGDADANDGVATLAEGDEAGDAAADPDFVIPEGAHDITADAAPLVDDEYVEFLGAYEYDEEVGESYDVGSQVYVYRANVSKIGPAYHNEVLKYSIGVDWVAEWLEHDVINTLHDWIADPDSVSYDYHYVVSHFPEELGVPEGWKVFCDSADEGYVDLVKDQWDAADLPDAYFEHLVAVSNFSTFDGMTVEEARELSASYLYDVESTNAVKRDGGNVEGLAPSEGTIRFYNGFSEARIADHDTWSEYLVDSTGAAAETMNGYYGGLGAYTAVQMPEYSGELPDGMQFSGWRGYFKMNGSAADYIAEGDVVSHFLECNENVDRPTWYYFVEQGGGDIATDAPDDSFTNVPVISDSFRGNSGNGLVPYDVWVEYLGEEDAPYTELQPGDYMPLCASQMPFFVAEATFEPVDEEEPPTEEITPPDEPTIETPDEPTIETPAEPTVEEPATPVDETPIAKTGDISAFARIWAAVAGVVAAAVVGIVAFVEHRRRRQ